MSSIDIRYIEILNTSIIYLNRYIVPILFILGNIGNILSALIFFKKTWKKNVCVFYFNVCLFLDSCFINSTVLTSILSSFNITLHNSNVFLCKLYFYVIFIFSTLSPTILILASIDRLLISSQNVDTRLYSSKRLAYFSVSISTAFWIIFYFHVLIKVNIQEMSPSNFMCYYDPSYTYRQFVSYSSLIINVLLCVIMILLCMFAFKNIRHIQIVPRHQRKEIRSMTKKDFQLLRCLFVQDIIYSICSTGLCIFILYQAATTYQIRTPLEKTIMNFSNSICTFLYRIPFCTNFYIFVVISKAFRNELKRMIYKICGKEITLIREENNTQENIESNIAVINHIVSLN